MSSRWPPSEAPLAWRRPSTLGGLRGRRCLGRLSSTFRAFAQLVDKLRAVIPGTVDLGTDRVGAHLLRRIRPQQRQCLLRRSGQPGIVILRGNDDRHASMKLRRELVGIAGDYAARFD